MQITIMMAVSADGFIARKDGKTDWVQDDDWFEKACIEYGCIVMGSATLKEYGDPPFENVQHIVLSGSPTISGYKNVHFVTSPEKAVAKAEELGFDRLLVIGGAKTNASFLQAGLVQNLTLDVHNLLLGTGIPLSTDHALNQKLRLVHTQPYENFVHNEYELTE